MTVINFHRIRISAILPALAFLALALLLFSCLPVRNSPLTISVPSDKERLILYTSMQEEIFNPLVREFEDRTGIWVSVKTGGSLSELSRISSGEEAGWDVILAPADALETRSDLFAPACDFAPEQLLAPGNPYASSSQAIFPYSSSNISIIYNTKLVRLYPPDSWLSLLDPVWNGRIAFLDPQSTAEGFSFRQAIAEMLSGHESIPQDEFYQALAGPYFSDTDDLIRAVANGTYYIGVISEDAALRAAADGYDITVVHPQERTDPIANAAAVLKDSPRLENAGKFLAFLEDGAVREYLVERFFFYPYSGESMPETEVGP